MKAVGYQKPLPISDAESLLDIEVPTPKAAGRDVLVEVKAISVNPVEAKVRASTAPEDTQYKILGWDAAARAASWFWLASDAAHMDALRTWRCLSASDVVM